MKKILKLSFISLLCLMILTGCTTPEDKVENLKAEKIIKLEDSGYNKCMEQVKKREMIKEKCETDKLKERGYTDDIDCIECPECNICEEIGRYNAEVDAINDCMEIISQKYDDPSALTAFDCMELLQN